MAEILLGLCLTARHMFNRAVLPRKSLSTEFYFQIKFSILRSWKTKRIIFQIQNQIIFSYSVDPNDHFEVLPDIKITIFTEIIYLSLCLCSLFYFFSADPGINRIQNWSSLWYLGELREYFKWFPGADKPTFTDIIYRSLCLCSFIKFHSTDPSIPLIRK